MTETQVLFLPVPDPELGMLDSPSTDGFSALRQSLTLEYASIQQTGAADIAAIYDRAMDRDHLVPIAVAEPARETAQTSDVTDESGHGADDDLSGNSPESYVGYLMAPGGTFGVLTERIGTDMAETRQDIPVLADRQPAEFRSPQPQKQERSHRMAKLAGRIGQVATESWRRTKRATAVTAKVVGGLTVAGVVGISPVVIANAGAHGVDNMSAGSMPAQVTEFQNVNTGKIASDTSAAFRRHPKNFEPVVSQMVEQPVARALQFGRGLYQAEGAGVYALFDAAVLAGAYRWFRRRQDRRATETPPKQPRGYGQLDILRSMFI